MKKIVLVLFVMLVFVIGTAEKLPPVPEPDGIEEYTEEMVNQLLAEIEQDTIDTIQADEQAQADIEKDMAEIDALFVVVAEDPNVVKDRAYFDREMAEAIALYEAEEKAQEISDAEWEVEAEEKAQEISDAEWEVEAEIALTQNDNEDAAHEQVEIYTDIEIQEDELTLVDEYNLWVNSVQYLEY